MNKKDITESLNYRIFSNTLQVSLELYVEQLLGRYTNNPIDGVEFPIDFDEAMNDILPMAKNIHHSVVDNLPAPVKKKEVMND